MSYSRFLTSPRYFMRDLPSSVKNKILLKHCLETATIPVRNLGRGKKIPIFGHSTEIPESTPTRVMVSVAMASFIGLIINWRYLKEELGIQIPILSNTLILIQEDSIEPGTKSYNDTSKSIVQTLADVDQDEIFNKNARVLHQEMIDEATKRAEEKKARDKKDGKSLDQALERQKDRAFLDLLKANVEVKAKDFSALSNNQSAIFSFNNKKSDQYDEEEMSEQEEDSNLRPSKKGVGFRNRKIMEYENRIRQYSTPDKVFRYFATYKVSDEKGHSEVMMSPEDFIRSITPGFQQPEHLGLDQFNSISADDISNVTVQLGLEESSIFYQLGSGGLISFSDYMFLLTVLSTSRRHFEIAFKMFDLNADGNISSEEFEVVTNLMKSQSSMGARHRDHTGSTFKGINSGLMHYFFGKSREGILTVDKFLEFQRTLQNEILALEFKRKVDTSKNNHNDRMREKDFAELLIAYAGFSQKKKTKMLKRVRREYQQSAPGISMSDYLNFYQVLYNINDIDTALSFYHISGAPIERSTMRHVAKTVSGVDLSEHLIDVVFVLFDENGDGKLSNKEFVSVIKQRAMRGLEKPKDTGLGRIFSAMTKCAPETRPTILGGMRKTE